MTKKEARIHFRQVIGSLNERSRDLKVAIRKPHTGDHAPVAQRAQAELASIRRMLTVGHAMLAHSRGRLHPGCDWFKRMDMHQMEPALARTHQRNWIETEAEKSGLARHFLARRGDPLFEGLPSVNQLWVAFIQIPDPVARETAYRLGGIEATTP